MESNATASITFRFIKICISVYVGNSIDLDLFRKPFVKLFSLCNVFLLAVLWTLINFKFLRRFNVNVNVLRKTMNDLIPFGQRCSSFELKVKTLFFQTI